MNSKAKTILKVLLVIIIVSIIIFLVIELRKFFIIKDLENKVSKYENSRNYHIASVASYEDGTTTKIDTYVKENWISEGYIISSLSEYRYLSFEFKRISSSYTFD